MRQIPVVDMRQLQGDGGDRLRAGQQIVDGLRYFGLFYLLNHGIDPGLRRRFFELLLKYARLPAEVRASHVRPETWGQRGWAEGERAVATNGALDNKGWLFANPVPFSSREAEARQRRRWPIQHPPNYWPAELPDGLRQAYLAYGFALHEANIRCQRAEALALGLPEETFASRLIDGPHNTRALIYWPLTEEMLGQAAWGGDHVDFNDETVLGGGIWVTPDGELTDQGPDPESGLFLQTKDGDWVSGQAPPGCIVVQCGQEKEIVTGGELLATPHVIRPPRATGWMRLAFAHFAHQSCDCDISPLPGFDSPDRMEQYGPPRLGGTFHTTTLHQIALSGLTDGEMVAKNDGYPYHLLRQRLGQGSPAKSY